MTSGCFYPRSNHWEVGGRPQCDKCLQSSELLTASFHEFGDNFKLQEQLSGGSVVVVHEEPHPQMTGTLSYRPEERGGRQREKSLDTRHRRRSLWCREHRNWRDNEWGRVLFTDESRFSLSSDSHRILIWRERGSRNHPSNIIERDRYGGRGVLVWGGIMLGSRTDLHIFDAGSVNGTRYCNEILLPCVRLFRGAMGLQFLFMDDNAPCHRTVAAEKLLENEDIECRRLAARTLPPVTIQELRFALQDEWAAMPQQLIHTLILSMGRRCETCPSSQGRSYPLLKTGCFLLDTHHRDVSVFSRIALHATFSIKLLFIPLISLLKILTLPWCCCRVLPDENEGKLPEPDTGWNSNTIDGNTTFFSTSTIWAWARREGNILQYSTLLAAATAHRTLGLTDLTTTYSVYTRRLFGGIGIEPRPSGLESDALTTRQPTTL
ncbi:transposable element Tcb1 transposase [Trichonephila clavipes]|nr:transposable element Tcb1 transposase [Trichonephila clavipes]